MKIHTCLQGSDEWLWRRIGLPTASEFGRIIKPSTGEPSAAKTVGDYIAELIAEQVCPDYTGGFTSRAMWQGTNVESEARQWYAYATDTEVRQVGFVTDDGENYGCSPDGLAEPNGLELKGPIPRTHVGYMLDPESLRAEYRVQCHGGMVVCERRAWHLMSYCPPFEPVLVRFEWDDFTDKLAAALKVFTERYAEARERFAVANGRPVVKPPRPRVRVVDEPIWM